MNASKLAKHLGVSIAAVTKAARAGQLEGAIRWDVAGKKRTMVVTDLARAVKLWLSRPGARAPALERARTNPAPAPASQADAKVEVIPYAGDLAGERLRLERYKAKNEQLDYERRAGKLIPVEEAMRVFGKQIQGAKSAVMALGKHARGLLPHLTVDDVQVIEQLAREALEGLASGAIQKPTTEGIAQP